MSEITTPAARGRGAASWRKAPATLALGVMR